MNLHNKSSYTPPAVKTAMIYLENLIESEDYPPCTRLPSIHNLAKSAGVSLVTMWKAVNGLKSRGIISVVQGQGIKVLKQGEQNYCQETDTSLKNINKKRKWETLRDNIYQDIINGIYPLDEELPSLKEICYSYHTCFSTLKKALNDLADDNVITPSRRSYRISYVKTKKTFSSIIIFTRGESSGELNTWTPWGRDFMRILESRGAHSNVSVTYYIYQKKGGKLSFITEEGETVSWPEFSGSVLGFIVRAISEDNLHLELLEKLNKYNKYIAVSDEGTCSPLPMLYGTDPRIQSFSLATSKPVGREVARFLLFHNHRKIAFISPFHDTCWSKNRLQGLIEAYKNAGVENAVEPFVQSGISFPFGFRKENKPDKDSVETILKMPFLNSGKNTFNESQLSRNAYDFLERTAEEKSLWSCLEPIFNKAAGNRDITAWVCVNDRIALKAYEYLRYSFKHSRGISVVSFDDTFDAFNHNFSSYNFNINALANAMFSFILYPRSFKRTLSTQKTVRIEGMMIKRGIKDLSE